VKLTEAMVARLLPKMKLQVEFLELQKTLQADPVPRCPELQPVVLEPQSSGNLLLVERPTASEQNGWVSFRNACLYLS
jgi:hypothetical protein